MQNNNVKPGEGYFYIIKALLCSQHISFSRKKYQPGDWQYKSTAGLGHPENGGIVLSHVHIITIHVNY